MKQILFVIALMANTILVQAQFGQEPADTSWKKIYRATPTKINNLVHTKLECSFDYQKAYLYGKVWITLQPHFYPTDSLTLDAKGMELKEVAIMNGSARKKLTYDYDGMQIKIKLGKSYNANEKYIIYIDYISKPNELASGGSSAITEEKGLYFINPKGEEKNKPIQIWTQGESEATSAWCPTIDATNQKTTNEIIMTVPEQYVTLSNGIKISEKKNGNGTRTDHWKMDLPHAPYLFFMGVGDYAIVKDKPYKGKEVSYYVEKDQAQYALGVFGNTPEMIQFFSQKLGVDYPWQKYSQIVGRDYVSGAMENTTATLHQESAYQNARELADQNTWEGTIAHELFHQWFGDLVTTESWSNLTLNESFADYSEYLWDEYKYGKDAADATHLNAIQGYLFGGNEKKDLVRFKYSDEMDMFDGVSYAKGGRILHMLRKYVGDAAFFKSLNLFLTTHKFKAAEAHQLRLAFEEVTGQDLNWFFNQWYFGSGHPKLTISNSYDAPTETLKVIVEQTQTTGKVFQLPLDIDVYIGDNKKRHRVWAMNKVDTFYFNYGSKPDLVDVDGDRILLAERKETKTKDEYVIQYKKNPNYIARREAIDFFAKNKSPELAMTLKDKYHGLRVYALNKINALTDRKNYIQEVENMFISEKNNLAKAAALRVLAKEKDPKYESYFTNHLNAVSYSVAGAALEGYASVKPEKAYAMAQQQTKDVGGALKTAVNKIIIEKGSESDFEYLSKQVIDAPLSQSAFTTIGSFAGYLAKMSNLSIVKKGIDAIKSFRSKIPGSFLDQVDPAFKNMLAPVGEKHGDEIKKYIEAIFK